MYPPLSPTSGKYLNLHDYSAAYHYYLQDKGFGVTRIEMKTGKRFPDTKIAFFFAYPKQTAIYFVAKGSGSIITDSNNPEGRTVQEGEVYIFDPGEKHAWLASGELQLCVVHTPNWDESFFLFNQAGELIP